MTTQQQAPYDAPAQWLPRMIQWAEESRDHYESTARDLQRNGYPQTAASYLSVAYDHELIARACRARLAALTDEPPPHLHTPACPFTDCPFKVAGQSVGLADACAATDEPPRELVKFVPWLRDKLGRYLPWVPAEIWQAVGCALLTCRPGWRP